MKAHPELAPQRTALANHLKSLIEVSFYAIDTISSVVGKLRQQHRYGHESEIEEVLDRVDLSAGKMETWLKSPQWKDAGELPGVRTTIRKTTRILGERLEKFEGMESNDFATLLPLVERLRQDLKLADKHITHYLTLLERGEEVEDDEGSEGFPPPNLTDYQQLIDTVSDDLS